MYYVPSSVAGQGSVFNEENQIIFGTVYQLPTNVAGRGSVSG